MGKKTIGIDLGTGNSCVATMENGKPIVIINNEGSRTTPSIISLKNGERKIGESAKRQRVITPKETVSLIKRFMGVDFDKCEDIIKHVSYDVINYNGKPRIKIENKDYSPEELSSYIIGKMKKIAEDYVGEEIQDAVITCPAWFDNAAREATKLAGEMAGLKVHRIINEPTAAILASNINTKDSKIVLVADVGCGTTDFSICEVSDGMVEVLVSNGDVFLGGSDFDNAIADYITKTFENENNVSLNENIQAKERILEAAEKAKIELSSNNTTEINLPYITLNSDNVPLHLSLTLTRSKLEQLTNNLVKRIINCAKEAVKLAKINKDDIDSILLVGGQTRSIAIQNALIDAFGDKLNKSINPDEAVALGAAIQADIISGDGEGSNDILLLDVTPISLGIETMGGVFTKLIEANTTIPCKKTEIFSTAADNQTIVDIHVLQGERPLAKDNKSIGLFRLDGITPAQRGIPQIEVSFDIDANGILKVSAIDKATNKEQSITIESKGNLTEEEIERIKQEAKEYAENDAKEKEKIDILNKGESIIFNNEKMLKELTDKLTDDEKENLTNKNNELKDAVNSKNVDLIKQLENEINELWNNISSKLYSANTNSNNL